MSHTDNATKTILKAIPTIDDSGKVVKWEVDTEYALNDYVSAFRHSIDVEPTKAPSDYTKAELWDLIGEEHLDAVFESQYESVVLAPAPTEHKVEGFDVDSLS